MTREPSRSTTSGRRATDGPVSRGSPKGEGGLSRRGRVGLRRGSALRGALILNVVLLHLAVERRPVEAQDLRRLLLVPVRPLQCLEDRHLLDLGERAVRGNREILRGGAFLADCLGK